MPPVNPPTPTSSNNISWDSSNPEDQDIWFDAIDHVEMDDTWFEGAEAFDTHEEHQADPSSSAGEAADSRVPFTEDCRRGVQQFVRTLGEYGESRMLSACLSRILPGTPVSLVIAANSLYTAVTERRNIDTAALHALGLASWYLPENINVVSRLASFIRDTVTGWTDETFLQQFLGNEDNHTSIHLFTALAVTAIVAGRWMKDEGAPQRGVLKVPAFMANIFIRASHYWTALGNMASSLPSGAANPENTATSQYARAFEVDTQVETETIRDVYDATASGTSALRTTAFSSNSTADPKAYTRATVQNRPAPEPGGNTHLSLPEQAHYMAVNKLREKSGLSDLLYCTDLKTETRQQTRENIITNSYFNTKCDATVYPVPLRKESDSIPARNGILERQISPEASDIPAFTSEINLFPVVSQSTAHSDNSGNGFSAMLSPVVNALYGADKFIARYDPLRFSGGASALPIDSQQVNKPVNSMQALPENTELNNYSVSQITEYIHSFYITMDDKKLSNLLASLIEKNHPSVGTQDEIAKINEILDYLYIISHFLYENHVSEKKLNYGKVTLKQLLLVLDSLNCPESHEDRMLKTLAKVLPLVARSNTLPDIASIIISSASEEGRLKEQEEKIIFDANEMKNKDSINTEDNKNINYILQLIHGFESLSKNNEESSRYSYIIRQLNESLAQLDGETGKYFSFIRKINVSVREVVFYSGTLTQDKRGEGYRSVEEQIAQYVVRVVNWYDDGFQHTASYGEDFDARKSLLTYALVLAGISDVNQLPDDWYKGENPFYLYWYLMGNLEEYTDEYGNNVIVDAAKHFYERCNENNPGEKNNKLDIKGLKKIEFKDYNNRHKLIFLRYYLEQEINMEQSPGTSQERLYKIANVLSMFMMIGSLFNRGMAAFRSHDKIRHSNLNHPKKIKRRRNNNIKKYSGRGAVKKNTQQDNQVVKGTIGDAYYTIDKKTKNLDITAHGMPFRTGANGVSSASKISDEIKKLSSVHGDFNRIKLRSCYGAKGGCFSQGQVIADKTQTKVTAYKNKYTERGGIPFLGSGGKTKLFEPSNSKIQQTMNDVGNKALGSPMAAVHKVVSQFKKDR